MLTADRVQAHTVGAFAGTHLEPTTELARVVIASGLETLFALDPAWTKDNVLQLSERQPGRQFTSQVNPPAAKSLHFASRILALQGRTFILVGLGPAAVIISVPCPIAAGAGGAASAGSHYLSARDQYPFTSISNRVNGPGPGAKKDRFAYSHRSPRDGPAGLRPLPPRFAFVGMVISGRSHWTLFH